MINLDYKDKEPIDSILSTCEFKDISIYFKKPDSKNILIQGENLIALKWLLFKGGFRNSVDLIYIDPPFSTNNTFTISDDRANTISSSDDDEVAYSDNLVGEEFIEFLRKRLILMRELLSDAGSIYLHIDYKIGHYVKIIMDEIFGMNNFRNDITRIKCNPKNFCRKAYGNIKDLILFYTKTDNYIWNEPRVSFKEEDILRLFPKIDKKGRRYTTVPIHAPGETKNGATGQQWKGMNPPKGRHWRSSPEELDKLDKDGLIEWSNNGVPRRIIYASKKIKEGMKLQDIWEYKDPQYPIYPTEKNLDLLNLIISTSSNPDSIVMDCFCGSGTTLFAANSLCRRWIGIDKSEKAIEVTKKRMTLVEQTIFESENSYECIGIK